MYFIGWVIFLKVKVFPVSFCFLDLFLKDDRYFNESKILEQDLAHNKCLNLSYAYEDFPLAAQ